MTKFLFLFVVSMITTSAMAATHSCRVSKSLQWVDANNETQNRAAETAVFDISENGFETLNTFQLQDQLGVNWGSLVIKTATIGQTVQMSVDHVNETNQVDLVMPLEFDLSVQYIGSFYKLDLPATDLDPMFMIYCKHNP